MATSAPIVKGLLSLASEWHFSSGMSCLFSIKCSIVKKKKIHMSCFTEFIGLSFIYVIVMMISVLKYFPNFSLSLTCISFWKRTSYLIYTNADEQISHLDVSVKLQVYQMRCLLLYCGDALGGLTFGRDCSTDAMKKPYYVTVKSIWHRCEVSFKHLYF